MRAVDNTRRSTIGMKHRHDKRMQAPRNSDGAYAHELTIQIEISLNFQELSAHKSRVGFNQIGCS